MSTRTTGWVFRLLALAFPSLAHPLPPPASGGEGLASCRCRRCRGRPAERPVPGQAVLLKLDDVAVPRELLDLHLSALRLPQATDSAGRLVLPFLASGRYELFAADATSEAQLQAGAREGFLGSVELAGEAVVRVRWGVGD